MRISGLYILFYYLFACVCGEGFIDETEPPDYPIELITPVTWSAPHELPFKSSEDVCTYASIPLDGPLSLMPLYPRAAIIPGDQLYPLEISVVHARATTDTQVTNTRLVQRSKFLLQSDYTVNHDGSPHFSAAFMSDLDTEQSESLRAYSWKPSTLPIVYVELFVSDVCGVFSFCVSMMLKTPEGVGAALFDGRVGTDLIQVEAANDYTFERDPTLAHSLDGEYFAVCFERLKFVPEVLPEQALHHIICRIFWSNGVAMDVDELDVIPEGPIETFVHRRMEPSIVQEHAIGGDYPSSNFLLVSKSVLSPNVILVRRFGALGEYAAAQDRLNGHPGKYYPLISGTVSSPRVSALYGYLFVIHFVVSDVEGEPGDLMSVVHSGAALSYIEANGPETFELLNASYAVHGPVSPSPGAAQYDVATFGYSYFTAYSNRNTRQIHGSLKNLTAFDVGFELNVTEPDGHVLSTRQGPITGAVQQFPRLLKVDEKSFSEYYAADVAEAGVVVLVWEASTACQPPGSATLTRRVWLRPIILNKLMPGFFSVYRSDKLLQPLTSTLPSQGDVHWWGSQFNVQQMVMPTSVDDVIVAWDTNIGAVLCRRFHRMTSNGPPLLSTGPPLVVAFPDAVAGVTYHLAGIVPVAQPDRYVIAYTAKPYLSGFGLQLVRFGDIGSSDVLSTTLAVPLSEPFRAISTPFSAYLVSLNNTDYFDEPDEVAKIESAFPSQLPHNASYPYLSMVHFTMIHKDAPFNVSAAQFALQVLWDDSMHHSFTAIVGDWLGWDAVPLSIYTRALYEYTFDQFNIPSLKEVVGDERNYTFTVIDDPPFYYARPAAIGIGVQRIDQSPAFENLHLLMSSARGTFVKFALKVPVDFGQYLLNVAVAALVGARAVIVWSQVSAVTFTGGVRAILYDSIEYEFLMPRAIDVSDEFEEQQVANVAVSGLGVAYEASFVVVWVCEFCEEGVMWDRVPRPSILAGNSLMMRFFWSDGVPWGPAKFVSAYVPYSVYKPSVLPIFFKEGYGIATPIGGAGSTYMPGIDAIVAQKERKELDALTVTWTADNAVDGADAGVFVKIILTDEISGWFSVAYAARKLLFSQSSTMESSGQSTTTTQAKGGTEEGTDMPTSMPTTIVDSGSTHAQTSVGTTADAVATVTEPEGDSTTTIIVASVVGACLLLTLCIAALLFQRRRREQSRTLMGRRRSLAPDIAMTRPSRRQSLALPSPRANRKSRSMIHGVDDGGHGRGGSRRASRRLSKRVGASAHTSAYGALPSISSDQSGASSAAYLNRGAVPTYGAYGAAPPVPGDYDSVQPLLNGAGSGTSKLRSNYQVVPMRANHARATQASKVYAGTGFAAFTALVYERLIVEDVELERGEVVGRGWSGIVYRGKWRDNDVAIKDVYIEDASGRGDRTLSVAQTRARDAFLKEAAAMQSIDAHPNVLPLLAVVIAPNVSLVTPFCERGSLESYLYGENAAVRCEVVRGADARRWLVDICRALAHLHANSVVHRDVAARNILVAADDRLMMTDFGMSRRVEALVDGGNDAQQTRQRLGPVKWMAPEQLRARQYSPASDVWSLAVTALEISAREPPWRNVSNVEAAAQIQDGQLPHMSAALGAKTRELLLRCFSLNAKERPSANEMAELFASMRDIDVLVRDVRVSETNDTESTAAASVGISTYEEPVATDECSADMQRYELSLVTQQLSYEKFDLNLDLQVSIIDRLVLNQKISIDFNNETCCFADAAGPCADVQEYGRFDLNGDDCVSVADDNVWGTTVGVYSCSYTTTPMPVTTSEIESDSDDMTIIVAAAIGAIILVLLMCALVLIFVFRSRQSRRGRQNLSRTDTSLSVHGRAPGSARSSARTSRRYALAPHAQGRARSMRSLSRQTSAHKMGASRQAPAPIFAYGNAVAPAGQRFVKSYANVPAATDELTPSTVEYDGLQQVDWLDSSSHATSNQSQYRTLEHRPAEHTQLRPSADPYHRPSAASSDAYHRPSALSDPYHRPSASNGVEMRSSDPYHRPMARDPYDQTPSVKSEGDYEALKLGTVAVSDTSANYQMADFGK